MFTSVTAYLLGAVFASVLAIPYAISFLKARKVREIKDQRLPAGAQNRQSSLIESSTNSPFLEAGQTDEALVRLCHAREEIAEKGRQFQTDERSRALLVVGSPSVAVALATVASAFFKADPTLYWLFSGAASCFLLLALLKFQKQSSAQASWKLHRAAAEILKREVFFYIARCGPYTCSSAEAARGIAERRLKELKKTLSSEDVTTTVLVDKHQYRSCEVADNLCELEPYKIIGEVRQDWIHQWNSTKAIAPSSHLELHGSPLALRAKFYQEKRINSQISFYKRRIDLYKGLNKVAKICGIISALLAFVTSMAAVIVYTVNFEGLPVPSSLTDLGVAGIILTLILGVFSQIPSAYNAKELQSLYSRYLDQLGYFVPKITGVEEKAIVAGSEENAELAFEFGTIVLECEALMYDELIAFLDV